MCIDIAIILRPSKAGGGVCDPQSSAALGSSLFFSAGDYSFSTRTRISVITDFRSSQRCFAAHDARQKVMSTLCGFFAVPLAPLKIWSKGGQVVFGRAAAQILSSEFRELEPEHKRRVRGVLPVLAPEWRLAKSWYLGCQTVDGGSPSFAVHHLVARCRPSSSRNG